MRKDPTEFRERFQRWKKGEQVYENGLALPAYEDGLTPLRKSEVNTNEAAYVPEEDLYKSRYTLPEVTVTGDKSKRVYHSHAPRTSGVSKNYQKWDTTDLLQSMITGSDVGDVADISKDLYNKDYASAGIGAAMLAVPNFIEKPLKPVGKFARNFVINNNDKISTLLAKSGVVKRAMNYAMHQTDAANPTSYILRDIGIKGYGSRNPSNVSIDEIKSFLLDRSKDKTKLKQVASYILFGKNKNKVIKDHTGIVGIDYQTNKTFNTSPASGFIGPKESVLFGKDMTAGKIENFADYGVHSNYIMHRPDQTPRRIYSTDAPYRNGLPTVDDDFITHTIPRTLSSLDDYMPIKTPFGIGSYDAGGHLIELGRGVDKKYYLRGQDIYKFDAVDYAKKHLDAFNNTHDYLQWAKQHPFLNLGLTTVQKAVKPIIVRSRWTPVDQVLDAQLTPNQVKKQIREVYDQQNQSALMYLVPRMNSYIK